MMLIIGLTGGIGSGKTVVSTMFAELGVPVIDADVIARKVTSDRQVLHKIAQNFGADILQNGLLNRKKLRAIIFANPRERLWLENLLHPLIKDEIERQVSVLKAPYCILSIPLLLEATPYPFIDRILVVDTDEEKQIERVMARDQLSREEVQAMMAAQIARSERIRCAHDVLYNNADLKMLERDVSQLHQTYLEMSRHT